MVSKGLHFDEVSLVAVLNADNLMNQPDFRAYEKAFQILHEQYGCKYMRTDSGGGLTNKLLENGLIDEISLVISPCFVGNKEKQLFDNLLLSEKVNLELQGTENAEHGCLSLRYAVKNKD